MEPVLDYLEINKALWNEKTRHHVESAFYNVEGFVKGETSLKPFELALLGDVRGKSILHLQCHFGQDTLSLARMGARTTGADFSEDAIAQAQELNEELGLSAEFICTDIYNLPQVLDKQYDIVFTSYGTVGWLPDMQRWAAVVARYVKPGGFFLIVDFHPVLWMYSNDFTHIQYSYFNKEAIVETLEGTYANKDADIKKTEVGWNHSLSEIMQALLDAGLHIKRFEEYDHSPYDCFQNMVETAPGQYNIAGKEGKLPMVYAIKAGK
ncbi:MAG: class I SAM-dependent methyltransferase [Bacteroidota bacterium]